MLNEIQYRQLQNDVLRQELINKGFNDSQILTQLEDWRQLFITTQSNAKKYRQERENLKNEKKILRQNIKRLEEENDRINGEVLRLLLTSKDSKTKEIGELKLEMLNLKQEKTRLIKTNKELEKQNQTQQVEIANLTKLNENLTDKNLDLETKLLNCDNQIRELQEQNQIQQNEIRGLTETNEIL